MKIALIGDRLTGKTTIFETVTGLDMSNTSDLVNICNIKVKDKSLDKLAEMYKPKKTTHAEIELVDYNRAQDSGGSSLGSQMLISKYRELDSLVLTVGIISDKAEIEKKVKSVLEELYLADTVLIESKIERLKKGKHDKKEMELYEKLLSKLEKLELIKNDDFTDLELKLLSPFQLLTLKNITFVINVDDSLISDEINLDIKYPYILLSAEIEKEISSLQGKDREEFLNEYNLKDSAIDRFLRMIYESMNLISFYTVGSDEVRAWSIQKGSNAVIAASKIHTDIARGFIRASTFKYADLIELGSEELIKKQGLLRDEGKEYIVKAGDIINFKFNV